MSRVSLFSAPFLLGFDALEERIDRLSQAADGYPPYNIERTVEADGSESFLISIAVAGFAPPSSTSWRRTISCSSAAGRKTIRAGNICIAASPPGSFSGASCWPTALMVKDAVLDNGMLVISVIRPKAEKLARRIEIRSA